MRWYVDDMGVSTPRMGRYLVRDSGGFTPPGRPSTFDCRQDAEVLVAELNGFADYADWYGDGLGAA
jgi:hypothetical protein